MKLLSESRIINALHKRQMARMNEELQDDIRHQETPYHDDIDTDIIPNNFEGTEDDVNSWYDKSFGYECPHCGSYFVSPEQLGADEDVDCPQCGKLIVPDEIEDFDPDDYEVDDGSVDDDFDEDDSEESDFDDDSDNFDDDEDIDEDMDEDADLMVRDGKKLSMKVVRRRRKRKKIIDRLPAKPGFRRVIEKDGKISYKPVKRSDLRKAGKMSQQGAAKMQRKKSLRKRKLLANNSNYMVDSYNKELPEYFDMDEQAVMVVMNRALKEAFEYNPEYIPFKLTDIVEAYYHADEDKLELITDIVYKDGEEDSAEFELTGISEGAVDIVETSGKFDLPHVSFEGTSAIINESIIIN